MKPPILPDKIPTEAIQLFTAQQAWHYKALPYESDNGTVKMFVAKEEGDEGLQEELEVILGKQVLLKFLKEDLLLTELGKYYRQPTDKRKDARHIGLDGQQPMDLLPNLLREAQELGSSDIHFEPYEKRCRIRFRIDGVLIERYVIDKTDYPSLVNKIKIQANLDIAEKRLPQDGRIFMKGTGKAKLDIRVSVLPTLYGEKIVMRLLGKDAAHIHLDRLGFEQEDLDSYLEGVKRPTGMVLISGPTGSGKTTTLYATLQLLNRTERNILTIEDPIEYTLEGINQVQLKENIGLDFPGAMRSFLRQDPDIIMVGEIRDQATAGMAIRASLTGHSVLSTIHTNWSWGIVARLMDMGIPSYLLADTLNTAVAQRLLRLLCPHCKQESFFDSTLYPPRYKPPRPLDGHFLPKGCGACFYTGYHGRRAIYEVITMDRELANLIKEGNLNVLDILKSKGFRSLADNAFELFAGGLTSMDEVYPLLAA